MRARGEERTKGKRAGLNQRWMNVEQMLIWSCSSQGSSSSEGLCHYWSTASMCSVSTQVKLLCVWPWHVWVICIGEYKALPDWELQKQYGNTMDISKDATEENRSQCSLTSFLDTQVAMPPICKYKTRNRSCMPELCTPCVLYLCVLYLCV